MTTTTKKKATRKKTTAEVAGIEGEFMHIPLDRIHPDPEQPRKHFDQQALDDLAADIAAHGVMQNLLVRDYITDKETRPGEYIIIVGERCHRASKIAGLETVPAVLDNSANDQPLDRLVAQVAENFSREELNPIELAHFFNRLVVDFGYAVSDIPQLLEEKGLAAMSRSSVSNHMRLVKLPKWAQDYVIEGKLAPRHARALLPALHSKAVLKDLKKIVDELLKDAERCNEPPTSDIIERRLYRAFDKHHVDLDCTWGGEAILYDWDETKDADSLGIVKIGRHHFAINRQEHDRRQAEARERIAEKERKRAEREKKKQQKAGGTGKAADKPIKRPAKEKLHAYLFAVATSQSHPEGGWLRRHILSLFDNLGEINPDSDTDPRVRLARWVTLDCPQPAHFFIERNQLVGIDDGPCNHIDVTAYAGILNITDALTKSLDQAQASRIIDAQARNAVRFMSSDNLSLLAEHLEVNLDAAWRTDEEYLALYTGPALDEIADQHRESLPMALYNSGEYKKVSGKRQFLLEHAELVGVTDDIRQLWEEELDGARSAIKEQQQYIAEQQNDSEVAE